MISIKELRQKNAQELTEFLRNSRSKLAESSSKAALKQLKNVKVIRSLRRDIARGLTILRQRRSS